MKKLGNRVLALLCSIALLAVSINTLPMVQAENAPSGLTTVRWDDLGFTEDTVINGSCEDPNWGCNDKTVDGKTLVNSSFRGTIKFHKTAGAMWFQYGCSYFGGTLGSNGVRFTPQDNGTLTVYNMPVNGSEIVTLNATDAGLSGGTFLDTTFELGLELWQEAGSQDLKLNVFINGVQYKNETYTVTGAAGKIDNSVCLVSQGIGDFIEVTMDQTSQMPELTELTWSDFGFTEDTVINGSCEDPNWGCNDKAVTGKELINSSFRGMLKFHKTAGAMWFQYGCSYFGGTLGTNGIRFTPQDNGTLTVYNMPVNGSEIVTLNAADAGLESGSFLDTAFELGVDLWQETGSQDLKLNVYINGTQYKGETYTVTGAAGKIDNSVCLVSQGIGDTIEITMKRDAQGPELTDITWSDLGFTEDAVINGSCEDPNWGCNDKAVTGKELINSSFRGTLKFHKTAGAMWFQYGCSYSGGTLGTNGIRFTPQDNGTLTVYNMPVNGSEIVTLNAADAGLESGSFLDTAFELGVDLWQETGSQDLKLNIYINGTQYKGETYTVTGVAGKIDNSVCLVSQGIGDYIQAVLQNEEGPNGEPSPEGLTAIGWSDLGIISDKQLDGMLAEPNWGCNDFAVLGEKQLTNSSFRGNIKFHRTAGAMYFQYGCSYGGGTLGANGIRFDIQNDGTIKVFNMPNGGTEVTVLNATDAGLSSGTFIDTEFELGVDLWQPEGSQDLKLNVFINGNQYKGETYVITDAAGKIDNSICLVSQGVDDYILVIADVIETPDTAPEGLTSMNWNDVGLMGEITLEGGASDANNWGVHAYSLTNKNTVDSSFRGTLKFHKAAGAMYVQYGVNGATSLGNKGIRFTVTDDGKLQVFDMTHDGSLVDTLSATTVELAGGTFLDKEFELGIDVWQPEETQDLKFIVYINGVQYNKKAYTIANGATNMEKGITLVTQGIGDYIKMIAPEYVLPEETIAPDKSLKKISFSSFNIADGLYQSKHPELSAQGGFFHPTMGQSLDGTLFNADVCFDGEAVRMNYGGLDDAWHGLTLCSEGQNLILLHVLNDMPQNIATFTPEFAGATLVGEQINLKISVNYVDRDHDGKKDDVKLGYWFNDRLYKNEFIYLNDYTGNLGAKLGIYMPEGDGSFAVKTGEADNSIDFSIWGFTKKFKEFLSTSGKPKSVKTKL